MSNKLAPLIFIREIFCYIFNQDSTVILQKYCASYMYPPHRYYVPFSEWTLLSLLMTNIYMLENVYADKYK